MSRLLLLCLLLSCQLTSYGQQLPQHPMVLPPGTNIQYMGQDRPFNGGANSSAAHRTQMIYYPSEFPGAPSGYVTDIFYQKGGYFNAGPKPDSITYKNLYIGIKTYTGEGDSLYIPGCIPGSLTATWQPSDTILFASTYNIYGPVDSGDWVKFHLQKPFYYSQRSFIIEMIVSDQQPTYPSGISTISFSQSVLDGCRGVAGEGATHPVNAILHGYINVIGLNIQPLSVASMEAQPEIMLYPNPVHDIFSLEIRAVNPVRDFQVGIIGPNGKRVHAEASREMGSSFTREINLSALPAGVYFMKLQLDDQIAFRKIVKYYARSFRVGRVLRLVMSLLASLRGTKQPHVMWDHALSMHYGL